MKVVPCQIVVSSNAASTTYTYPSTSHKLTSLSGATTRSFSYDNAGNTTSTLSVTYTYDGRGRLKQAGSTTYLVNGLGQRVKKSGGSDTYSAYDEAGRLIGEYDTSGTAIQETLWLGDTPVAVVKPASPSGFTVFYIWADHLGTPRQITDTSNVSRWEWVHNDPFGNNAPNENPASAGTFTYNLRFPGQYFDAETGTHYNYFRDYDPRIGRYIESDPIGLLGGLATYGYVSSQPLTYIDPWGLCQVAVWGYGAIIGWKPCPGGDQPSPAMPPRPKPQPSGGNQCEASKCQPYDPNIPLRDIPYYMKDSFGGLCFANCAIRASIGLGVKHAAEHGAISGMEGKEWIGKAAGRFCGRAILLVGLGMLANDFNSCRSECTIQTPTLR